MDLICISLMFCGDLEEPDSHLIFTNDFASWVRYNFFRWLGWELILPTFVFISLYKIAFCLLFCDLLDL